MKRLYELADRLIAGSKTQRAAVAQINQQMQRLAEPLQKMATDYAARLSTGVRVRSKTTSLDEQMAVQAFGAYLVASAGNAALDKACYELTAVSADAFNEFSRLVKERDCTIADRDETINQLRAEVAKLTAPRAPMYRLKG